jgi:hypothetical protein
VEERAEGPDFRQSGGAEEVAGVDHRFGLADQLDAPGRQAAGAPGHVGVGKYSNHQSTSGF